MTPVRIALAQINPVVGDIKGNLAIIKAVLAESQSSGADLVVFPELAITGYPPEDLLLKSDFVDANLRALKSLANSVRQCSAVVGFVDEQGGELYNAAAIIDEGEVKAVYHKHLLPNYGVFDEERYFEPGQGIILAKMGDLVFGVTVCEDLWWEHGPSAECASAGAELIVNINASPFHMGKGKQRQELLSARARANDVSYAYVNAVGGQDELVFDGGSCFVTRNGDVVARAGQFVADTLLFDLEPTGPPKVRTTTQEGLKVVNLAGPLDDGRAGIVHAVAPELSPEEEAYRALVLGVRDYLDKNGFKQALIGLSGGIDSALTACIAVEAIGAENVLGVCNPSGFTSGRSVDDAAKLASNLGIDMEVIAIAPIFEAMLTSLRPLFGDSAFGIAEENLQARIRGMLWMAISNKFGRIVLSTGNKSEMAVGYATLYGDMAGGFAVLKDVPKTLVYRIADLVNRDTELIPSSIIERPPTAELRPDQLDTDSLPPYDVLDPILQAYVEDDLSIDKIVAQGFDHEVVCRVVGMVDSAEYKRRQAPPGIKITDRAFGRDRRLPITNRYRPYL